MKRNPKIDTSSPSRWAHTWLVLAMQAIPEYHKLYTEGDFIADFMAGNLPWNKAQFDEVVRHILNSTLYPSVRELYRAAFGTDTLHKELTRQ